MITVHVNAETATLWVLAGIGALWLLPRLVRGCLVLASAIVFLVMGDG